MGGKEDNNSNKNINEYEGQKFSTVRRIKNFQLKNSNFPLTERKFLKAGSILRDLFYFIYLFYIIKLYNPLD